MGARGPKPGTVDPNRKKRGVGKRTSLSIETVAKILRGKNTPLEFLLTVMSADEMPYVHRVEAARAAAPYVHKRMPMQVEHGGELTHTHRGGVMLVPAPEDNKDWEKRSAAAQASLKEDVKK